MKYNDGIERDIPDLSWGRVAVTMLILAVLATAGWELNWRSHGYEPLPKDTAAFWSIQRREASRAENPTVLVGSSRVLFDINLDVWERVTGERPIQLALEGTSGLVGLKHLADDPTFSGTVIVGVTPGLFFSGQAMRRNVFSHYESETPSQWLGQQIAMRLERYLAFLEAGNLPLFELLQDIPMPNREGVNPPHMGVMKLSVADWDRNVHMWHRVEEDPEYRQMARDIWTAMVRRNSAPNPDRPPPNPQPVIDEAKGHVESIRERGGDVVFLRCPSTDIWREAEAAGFPRNAFWDRLVTDIDVGSVHFEDNPSLQGLELPEWSHLSARDAERFTAAVAPLIRQALSTRSAVVTIEEKE